MKSPGASEINGETHINELGFHC